MRDFLTIFFLNGPYKRQKHTFELHYHKNTNLLSLCALAEFRDKETGRGRSLYPALYPYKIIHLWPGFSLGFSFGAIVIDSTYDTTVLQIKRFHEEFLSQNLDIKDYRNSSPGSKLYVPKTEEKNE